jgi:hypothetical protein
MIRQIIFTVGHSRSYEQAFQEQGMPQKLGKESDYPGGSVWKTAEEAQKYCSPDFSIYCVLADWDTDTSPSAIGPWHDLLFTSTLIRINNRS